MLHFSSNNFQKFNIFSSIMKFTILGFGHFFAERIKYSTLINVKFKT